MSEAFPIICWVSRISGQVVFFLEGKEPESDKDWVRIGPAEIPVRIEMADPARLFLK